MNLKLHIQRVISPMDVVREQRIYALSVAVYRQGAHGPILDLKNSSVHDWTSTLSEREFRRKLEADGHEVK